MKIKNVLKEKINSKKRIIGTWSSLSSPNVISVLGTSNLDFVIIDMEHSSSNYETVENMVKASLASGLAPIVRTYDDSSQNLLRTLETGVQSVMVPHVKTQEAAERIVKSCKYFPEGNRGLSPYTINHNYTHESIDKSLEETNKNIFIGVLVEGVEGLNNLEKIVEVEGIDLIYLGLFDLSLSIGLPGQLMHKKVLDEIIRCQKIISSKSILAGSMATDLNYINMLIEFNYNFIAYYNDAASLRSHYMDVIDKIKQ